MDSCHWTGELRKERREKSTSPSRIVKSAINTRISCRACNFFLLVEPQLSQSMGIDILTPVLSSPPSDHRPVRHCVWCWGPLLELDQRGLCPYALFPPHKWRKRTRSACLCCWSCQGCHEYNKGECSAVIRPTTLYLHFSPFSIRFLLFSSLSLLALKFRFIYYP